MSRSEECKKFIIGAKKREEVKTNTWSRKHVWK